MKIDSVITMEVKTREEELEELLSPDGELNTACKLATIFCSCLLSRLCYNICALTKKEKHEYGPILFHHRTCRWQSDHQ